MTRLRFAVIALGVLASGLLAGSGNASDEAARPSCFGARATIVGTAKSETLRGTQKRDVIVALAGADRVYGRGGNDLLCGGAGDDLLDGGPGRNSLAGGPGGDNCRRGARTTGCEAVPKPLPQVQGMTLDGDAVSLADYRGRKLFVNVWAAW